MGYQQISREERKLLEESINSGTKTVLIRLREGEYQYDLAKTIASFQLELRFPDVREIVKKLYGEGRASDMQFIRKTQTILKKMEKSNIVKILPKRRPWELQRYTLSSFRFQDVDKNLVNLAVDEEMKQSLDLLNLDEKRQDKLNNSAAIGSKVYLTASMIIVLYAISIWAILQPVINIVFFTPSFLLSAVGSILLGRMLSER